MAKCNKCGSTKNIKAGLGWRKGKRDVQRYRCLDCGKIFLEPDKDKGENIGKSE
jgi:transposase-like protein